MLGKSFKEFTSDTQFVNDLIKKVFKFKKVFDYEGQLRHKSGEILQCSFSVKLVKDEVDKSYKLKGTMRDITERKRTHDQLVQNEKNQRNKTIRL